jgi:hypothetical protein
MTRRKPTDRDVGAVRRGHGATLHVEALPRPDSPCTSTPAGSQARSAADGRWTPPKAARPAAISDDSGPCRPSKRPTRHKRTAAVGRPVTAPEAIPLIRAARCGVSTGGRTGTQQLAGKQAGALRAGVCQEFGGLPRIWRHFLHPPPPSAQVSVGQRLVTWPQAADRGFAKNSVFLAPPPSPQRSAGVTAGPDRPSRLASQVLPRLRTAATRPGNHAAAGCIAPHRTFLPGPKHGHLTSGGGARPLVNSGRRSSTANKGPVHERPHPRPVRDRRGRPRRR